MSRGSRPRALRRSIIGGLIRASSLLVIAPPLVSGQEAPEPTRPGLFSAEESAQRELLRAELEVRMKELGPLIEEAEQRALEADSRILLAANGDVSALDTVRVGPFRVVARSNRIGQAESVLRRVTQWHRTVLGEDGLLGPYIVFEIGPFPGRLGVEEPQLVWAKNAWNEAEIEHSASNAIDNVLRDALPEEVVLWLGTEAPADPSLGDQRKHIVREMATARAQSVRDCLQGEAGRCWQALGVIETEAPDGPGSLGDTQAGRLWYSDVERQQKAIDWAQVDRPGLAACERGDMDACDQVLMSASPWPVPPLGNQGRRNLLSFALERGGPGALERLISADGTIANRLAAASGLSAEDLMDEWQAFLQRDFEPQVAGSAGTLLTSLLWIGLFALIASASPRRRFA